MFYNKRHTINQFMNNFKICRKNASIYDIDFNVCTGKTIVHLLSFIYMLPCSLHVATSRVIGVHQGPVVQSIVSLTSSLRGQLVKCLTAL